MVIMGILLTASVIAIIILLLNLSYKRHCIEDTEAILKRNAEEFIRILKRLKDYQNFDSASRDTYTRRLLNESIKRYADEREDFETLVDLACEEYIKKELNNAGNENV